MNMSTPMSPKPLVNATCKLGKQGCFEDGRCHALGACENKIVTNADRIRAMSDEELAAAMLEINSGLCDYCAPQGTFCADCGEDSACRAGVLAWLRQPVER